MNNSFYFILIIFTREAFMLKRYIVLIYFWIVSFFGEGGRCLLSGKFRYPGYPVYQSGRFHSLHVGDALRVIKSLTSAITSIQRPVFAWLYIKLKMIDHCLGTGICLLQKKPPPPFGLGGITAEGVLCHFRPLPEFFIHPFFNIHNFIIYVERRGLGS